VAKYTPPEQGRGGQIADTLFILLLVFGALYLPIQLRLTGGGTVVRAPGAISWESLGQNAGMQAQWEKLGYTPATAAPIIAQKFDYTIRPVPSAHVRCPRRLLHISVPAFGNRGSGAEEYAQPVHRP
jgi:hypothetical protein